MYDVNIRRVMNGFIVSVGCQQVVFGSSSTNVDSAQEDMFEEIRRYFDDPGKVTAKYKKAFGLQHQGGEVPEPVPPAPGLGLRTNEASDLGII